MALTAEQISQFKQLSLEVKSEGGYEATSPAEQNLQSAGQWDPDEYARKQEISKQTGVPVEGLKPDNEKQIERSSAAESRLEQFRKLSEETSATKRYMENPVNAIVSQDDIETLAAIERESNRSWYELDERTFENWGDTALIGMGKTWDQMSIAFLEEVRGKGEATWKERLMDPSTATLTPIGLMQGVMDETMGFALETAAGGEEEFQMWKDKIGQQIESHKQNLEFAESEISRLTPRGLTVMEEGLRGGLQMIADMAPGLAISVATRGRFNPTLGYLTGKTYLDSYGSAMISGMDHQRAKGYATIDAVIEFATERLPTKRLEAMIGEVGGTGLKSSIKKWLVGEALGEQAATLTQSLNAYAHDLDDELAAATDIWEAMEIQGRRQAVTFISTLAGGGSMAGSIKGVDYLANRERRAMAKVIERTQKWRGSEAEQTRLDNLIYLAQSAKTNQRSKAQFEEFMEDAAPDRNVYIDPAALSEWMFADLGALPESLTKQLDGSGGMIEMSMTRFMTDFASDEARMEVIRPHIKTSEELYTPTELEGEDTNAFIKDLLESAATATETKSQADVIGEQLIEQLVATGRQSRATARQSTAVTVAQVVTHYEYLKKIGYKKEDGTEVTVEDLFNDIGVRIAKPEEQVGAREGAEPRPYMTQTAEPAYQDAPAAFETMRDSFLDKLPEDADVADLMDNIDQFDSAQRNVLNALARNDWLGFDYPAQAVNAAFSGELDNYEVGSGLKQAIGKMVNKELGFSPPPRVLRQQNFGNMAITETVVDPEDGLPLELTESADVLWEEQSKRMDNLDALRRCMNG